MTNMSKTRKPIPDHVIESIQRRCEDARGHGFNVHLNVSTDKMVCSFFAQDDSWGWQPQRQSISGIFSHGNDAHAWLDGHESGVHNAEAKAAKASDTEKTFVLNCTGRLWHVFNQAGKHLDRLEDPKLPAFSLAEALAVIAKRSGNSFRIIIHEGAMVNGD